MPKVCANLFDNSRYTESEEYANKVSNENDTVMIKGIYKNWVAWNKMIFVISKLHNLDVRLLEHYSRRNIELLLLCGIKKLFLQVMIMKQ